LLFILYFFPLTLTHSFWRNFPVDLNFKIVPSSTRRLLHYLVTLAHYSSRTKIALPPKPYSSLHETTRGCARHERSERGGEALCGEVRLHHPLPEPGHENEGGAFPLQQDLRVHLHHSRPTMPHALHLRHRPPHGARVRRALPQVAGV